MLYYIAKGLTKGGIFGKINRLTIRRGGSGMKKRDGFQLIEIAIVVMVIAVLLAIFVPLSVKAKETSRAKTCISNLKQIDAAKEQWAMDFRRTTGDTPSVDNLTTEAADSGRYIKLWPDCPSGGIYSINAIGTYPTCSHGGDHVLP